MGTKEEIRAPPGLERINELNKEPDREKVDEGNHRTIPTYKIRKLMSSNDTLPPESQLEEDLEREGQERNTLNLNIGYTRLEIVKGRWDTLLELLRETRPTDGRLQVYTMWK